MSMLLMLPLCVLHLSLATPRADIAPRPGYIPASTAAAPLAFLKVNPETARIRKRIDTAITMLEAGESRAFLEAFVEPEFLESKGVDAIIEEFEEEKVALLLSVLKEIRKKTPTYKEHGTVATFKFRKRPETHGTINFIRVDGVWYLRN